MILLTFGRLNPIDDYKKLCYNAHQYTKGGIFMDKQTLIEKIKAMAAAPSCCPELEATIQIYFDALGTSNEKSAAQNLIKEIEDDITDIDSLVAFAHSDRAKEIFGDNQKNFAAHADQLKSSGAKFCDCAACAPALEILNHKSILLA